MFQNKMLLVGVGGLVVLALGGFAVFNLALGDTAPAAGPVTAVPVVSTDNAVVFQIVPEKSQASFSIYEELSGQPKTVVGTTKALAGQLALVPTDLSQTKVGAITINARTFTTDSDRRNNAIRRFILNTDQFELITFTPTKLSGLSGSVQTGQALTFQLTGDLVIRDVTTAVTFDVTAQSVAPTQISGTAKAVVLRKAYNLQIPSVPNVANVGEEVTLQLDFVAEATR